MTDNNVSESQAFNTRLTSYTLLDDPIMQVIDGLNSTSVYSAPLKPIYALAGSGDTVGDTVNDAGSISIGGSLTGMIDEAGDADWYAVQLTAGQRYVFTMSGLNPNALLDPYLELMDASGAQVRFNDDAGGLNSTLYYVPETSGTYYVNAHAFINESNPSYSASGQYELTANTAPPLSDWTHLEIANFLTEGYWDPRSWASTSISYDVTALPTDRADFARQALEAWAGVSALTFTEVTSGAQLTFTDDFDDSDPEDSEAAGASTQTSLSGSTITGSTVNVSSNWSNTSIAGDGIDGYIYQTYLHEIGHALGLGHSGHYNGNATYGQDNLYLNDSWATSVMSYFDQSEAGTGSDRFVLAPQISDILAIQNLYGVNPNGTRAGDTTYGFNSTETDVNDWSQFSITDGSGTYLRPPSMAIYDTGGIDTIDLSGFATDQYLDMNAGQSSSLGVRADPAQPVYTNVISIAIGTIIENAVGGAGNDTFVLNTANNIINGGGGTDTVISSSDSNVAFVEFEGITYLGGSSVNQLINVETVTFSDNNSVAMSAATTFDAFGYLASHNDLINAFGSNTDLAVAHYVEYGFSEGRATDAFNSLQYIASHGDLIQILGSNPDLGTEHYVSHGAAEGRSQDTFFELQYLASHNDLLAAFGTNTTLATEHYIEYGFNEGRSTDLFNEQLYLASHNDLLAAFGTNTTLATEHYIEYGFNEGRSTDLFSEQLYLASHNDLLLAFGTNTALATAHYIEYGFNEGRATESFNAAQYLLNYGDLQAAFNGDQEAATSHYIEYGFSEGRTDAPPASASASQKWSDTDSFNFADLTDDVAAPPLLTLVDNDASAPAPASDSQSGIIDIWDTVDHFTFDDWQMS